MKLTPRLALVFILYATALLSVLAVLAYNSGRRSLRSATISELSATAIEKQAALNAWVEDKQLGIALLAADPATIESATALVSASPGSAEANAAHDRFVKEIQPRVDGGEFLAVMLIDPETGEVIAATDPSEEGKFKEDRPFFINGRLGPYVQNVYYALALQGPAMTASAPLRGSGGQLLGVLAGRINLEGMNSIINRRSGLRETDDAFLVNTSNLFVTQPYLVDDPAVLQRGVHTESVNRCLIQSSGTVEAEDYRGVPSIIAYRWIPEQELCLIVKIDQAEAYGPARAFGGTVAAISALAVLAAAVLALALARSLTRPILVLQAGAAGFGRGELETKLPSTSHDELGELAHEFNRMADSLLKKDAELRAHAQTLEQKVQERTKELQESHSQLLRAEEIAHLGSWELDLVNNRLAWSDEVYRIFGLQPQEFDATYEAFLEAVHPDDRAAVDNAYSSSIHEGRDTYEIEHRVVRRSSGEVRIVHEKCEHFRNEDGQIIRSVGMVHDVTARKQVEDALSHQSEELRRSNAELEQFAYVASHDLQEPLRMVSSYVQLLGKRYRGRLDNDADEFIAFAVDGATRMQNLINDLLAYSRVGRSGSALTSISCTEVLEEALTNLQIAIGESGAIITHEPLPVVKADRTQLVMVFQNLLGNAIKFRGSEPPSIHVGARCEGDEWIFYVRDNGIGLEPKFAERIFVIFQRLHDRSFYPGTGIGLAICKRIIQRHGGRIWVESQPGKGATFSFTLPVRGTDST